MPEEASKASEEVFISEDNKEEKEEIQTVALDDLEIDDLKEIAKDAGLEVDDDMSKEDLIKMLSEDEKDE